MVKHMALVTFAGAAVLASIGGAATSAANQAAPACTVGGYVGPLVGRQLETYTKRLTVKTGDGASAEYVI